MTALDLNEVMWSPAGSKADWFVDMSDHPVEKVAAHLEANRQRGFTLVHPDLWFDGVWVESTERTR
jgi:hypothetical protein